MAQFLTSDEYSKKLRLPDRITTSFACQRRITMLARTMHGNLVMSTRQKILQGMAECAWWMAWSDHAEEHGCVSLSGMEISEIAPPMPQEAFQLAEKALAKVETRILAHAALANEIRPAIEYCCGFGDTTIAMECKESPVCGALLVAALTDAGTAAGAVYNYYTDEYALRFGRCIAYDLVGAGVSWSDDHAEIPWPDMLDSHMQNELFCLSENTCSTDCVED